MVAFDAYKTEYRGSRQVLDEGWQQIRAGVALITWSRLASWDAENLALVAASETKFESAAGHKKVHSEFGRLLCWIAFGVGGEYLLKGVCLLRGCNLARQDKVIRLPSQHEDIENWVRLVNEGDPSIREVGVSFGTLGQVPLSRILNPGRERDLVSASITLLRTTIRNRDAHRYAQNVRAFHFHVVKRLFVPAFNIVLASLDQNELRVRLSGVVNQ